MLKHLDSKVSADTLKQGILSRIVLVGMFICLCSVNLVRNPSSTRCTANLENVIPANNTSADYSRGPAELRYNWLHLPVQSQLANELEAHQNDCELPVYNYNHRFGIGLGSDLHAYGVALCHAHNEKARLFAPKPWMWWDQKACNKYVGKDEFKSSMACYFPGLDSKCPNDIPKQPKKLIPFPNLTGYCPSLVKPGIVELSDVRAAMTELMFSNISSVVVEEAKRQHALVFPNGVPPPERLITVQIRWGDKRKETDLKPIENYIHGVEALAYRHRIPPNEVHVFLATEDPEAVKAFSKAMDKEWTLHVDQFHVEMLPHRNNETQNLGYEVHKHPGYHAGLKALGSLLVSMEANYYVLSTGSNWSRLIDELRKNVVRPRCIGVTDCTDMIDAAPPKMKKWVWNT